MRCHLIDQNWHWCLNNMVRSVMLGCYGASLQTVLGFDSIANGYYTKPMYTIPSPVRVEPFVWKCVTGTNMVLARFLWSMVWWCQLDPAETFAFHDTLLLIWLLMWEPNQTRLFQILGIWNISWKTGNAIWHGTCLWCLATGWSYGPKELPAETFAFAFANRPFGTCLTNLSSTLLCVLSGCYLVWY